MSDDRKYRQRGYQESDRDRKPGPKPAGPGGPPPRGDRPEGPRTPNLMPTREVIRCAKCGAEVSTPYGYDNRCSKCGVETHTCGQCTYFDPGARFQCMQPVTERIAVKDAKNSCTLWEPRKTVERATIRRRPTRPGARSTTCSGRQTFGAPHPSTKGERRKTMFSAIYDKADWGVGVLLLAAIVCLAFA